MKHFLKSQNYIKITKEKAPWHKGCKEKCPDLHLSHLICIFFSKTAINWRKHQLEAIWILSKRQQAIQILLKRQQVS